MRGKTWLVVCALVGCGRIDFAPLDDAAPAGTDAVGRCLQWSAFDPPVHHVELGAPGDDFSPTLSPDELTIYFYSARPGSMSQDIWTASRPAIGATWSTPVLVPNVESAAEERTPWMSSDSLTLGFSSDRAGGPGGLDLWWSKRTDLASPWGTPTLIANVSSPQDELTSNLSSDGLRLYIGSLRSGTYDVYVASRATTADDFGTPVSIAELNTGADEREITVSADELEGFIASNRAGSTRVDIYRTTRPDLATPWSMPVRVPELASALDDLAPDLSHDGTMLFFNYGADVSGGDAEIWSATRTCLAR